MLKRRLVLPLLLVLSLLQARAAHPAQANFVGNTNTKVFHLLSCRYAGCPHCTRFFSSREEAIDAGFRPGGCCHP